MDYSAIKSITIPEGKVAQIDAGGVTLWKAGLLPAAYQQVEWIQNQAISTTSGTYLDLGFAFDTAAVIHLHIANDTATSQPFGASENSGKLRCMISTNANAMGYGSNGSAYISVAIAGICGTGKEVNLVYTLKKGALLLEDLISGKTSNHTGQVEYTMTRNLYLFAQNYNTAARFDGAFKVYSFQYYDKNNDLICDLIPCYRKADGVIGMYDAARKTFLTNAGSGSFTKGADV